MKLISLKLENFRQHEDSFLEFNDGITIINGANGSGKSTILEAITWAIYGTEAARGNKDTIKFNRAKPRSKVRVELMFELDKDVFRVVRFLDKAEVYLGENASPVVTSQQEVTKYLIEKIGMTKNEFFNTYFTGQKELNFLKNQGPVERKKFISRVLNYDRIREAQEAARIDKNNLEKEISGLKQGLHDVEALIKEKDKIHLDLDKNREELAKKQLHFNKISDKLLKIEPEWEKIKSTKDYFEKLTWEKKSLLEKTEYLEKNTQNLSEQIKTLEEKEKKLSSSVNIENQYRDLDAKIREQESLQEKEALRQKYALQIEGFEKEIKEKELQLEEIVKSGKDKKAKTEQLPVLNEDINALNKNIQAIESDIIAQKREKEVLIKQKLTEIEKIKKQLTLIEEKGEDGACPTCERPLKNEFDRVTGNFHRQINDLCSEIEVIKKQQQEISAARPDLEELQKQKQLKEKEYNEFTLIKGDYEAEKRRYLNVKNDLDTCCKELEKTNRELGQIPEGFDLELLKQLREQIGPIRKQYEELLSLKAELTGFDRIKKDYKEAMQAKEETETRLKSIDQDLTGLNYSEEKYKETEKIYHETKEIFYETREKLIKIESEEKSIAREYEHISKIEELNKEKVELIGKKAEKIDLLYELDRFYSQLWEKLNDNARPEISDLAGKFLSDLTDNRYSMLELNEKYEICLHDDGEIKPVISGGEEDIVNLCIRLAVSQIIAQRSGKALSLLILDEIFGSLDENRRANVIYLLRSLTDHFEQVILITHIEDIKDEIDNIINIEFDPEKGCSKISSPDAGFDASPANTVQEEIFV